MLHSLQERTGHGPASTWTMLSLVTLLALSCGWRGTCVQGRRSCLDSVDTGFSCDWHCLYHIKLLLLCFKQSSHFKRTRENGMKMFLAVAFQTVSYKEIEGKKKTPEKRCTWFIQNSLFLKMMIECRWYNYTASELIILDNQNLIPYFDRIPCGHHGSNGSEVKF